MKKKIFLILLLVMIVFLYHSQSIHLAVSEYLDIGLTHSISTPYRVELNSKDGFSLYSVDGQRIRDLPDTRVTVEWDGSVFQIFGDSSGNFGEYSAEELMLSSRFSEKEIISIGKYGYRGFIKFITFKNKPVVINRIRMEEYLRGVVPSEMSPAFPKEALKAQAICARSFALANINKMSAKGYNLDDTTVCQAYFGTLKEDPRTDAAVLETTGQVAIYDNKVANTIFFSESAGYTENSSDVWGGYQPYLTAVEDPYSGTHENEWNYEISAESLTQLLYKNGYDVGKLYQMKLYPTPMTGSISTLDLIGSKGQTTVRATDFRNILGNTKLKSTHFRFSENDLQTTHQSSFQGAIYVINSSEKSILSGTEVYVLDGKGNVRLKKYGDIRGDLSPSSVNRPSFGGGADPKTYTLNSNIVFYGRGYGHGVGMPQASAKKMAEAGKLAEDIISFYFRGVTVELR